MTSFKFSENTNNNFSIFYLIENLIEITDLNMSFSKYLKNHNKQMA